MNRRPGEIEPLVAAALIAADLAVTVDREQSEIGGFMLRDVRFFFLLFRNWLEHDVRAPGDDIDLTQVRRTVERLAARRHIALQKRPARRRTRTPRARYLLTLAGVVALVESLVAPAAARSFETQLFVLLFAASYRALVIRRTEQAGAPVARKRIAKALDPRAIVAGLRSTLARQHADLKARISEGDELREAAAAGRAKGHDDAQIVRHLERLSSYQLHHVRPLGELLMSLPASLRAYELSDGIEARTRLVFEPLLRQTIAQQALLESILPAAIELARDKA
ncbi:MAG TPA: hypothetical protein VGM90_08465 [Kofleriaceae bacterium]|jgi:hypothetical protein